MKRKKILTIAFILLFLKIYSQPNQLDPIADSCANHLNNLSYDTGEVFVIFEINNKDVIYKETIESKESRNENSSSNTISIYPNPVNNILTILTSDKKEVTRIMLFSMDGRIIMDREIENNQIDLTTLPTGSYILKTNYNENDNFKLIKI